MANALSPGGQVKVNLEAVADKMLRAYALDCGINKRGESGVPSKKEVEAIVKDLLVVLFPGYLGDLPVPDSNARAYVVRAMESFSGRLTQAIEKTVLYTCKLGARCPPETEIVDAVSVVSELLQKMPSIRSSLALDVEAAFSGDPAARTCEEVIACYPSILAISIHRVAHELYLKHVPLVPRMMSEWAHSATGIDINPGAKVGLRFFIDHGTGTVIGETAEIGNNVRLYQGVTLGALSLPAKNTRRLLGVKRHPTVEDDVIIYSGATILGGDTVIGKGSIIGGNVWITASVPPNTKVTLAPPSLKYSGR